MHIHQCIQQQLVTCSVEVATAVQSTFGDRQLLVEFGFVGRTNFGNERFHLWVSGQHVGEDGQQLVAEVGDFFVLHFKVQHAQELAVRTRVGDDGLAAFVVDQGGHRHAVVGVTTHDGVDAADATGHLQVHVHAVV